jgi:S1-C subfamily serine protease
MITSAHVVAGSTGAVASFVDGRELEVEVVGADRLSDLAVVRTNLTLHSATLGDAAELKVGQLVVAMGNPLGFGGSVTAGIVSALGRSFATQAGSITRFVENVIQTDAALHPGNSGGALANGRGEVVGINTALIGPAVGQGLGLAVPINTATRRIISSLMSDGRVRRAYLGIVGGPRPLPPRVAQATGRDRGVEVVEVVPGSPAQQAGIRAEDLILEIDDVAVADMNDLQRVMDTTTIGRSVAVTVYRQGSNVRLEVTPAELTGD